MKRYNAVIHLLICIGLLCVAHVVFAGTALLDADNVGQALGMVSANKAVMEGTRKLCDQLLPTDKLFIDYYFFKWTLDNSAELAALQVFEEKNMSATFKSVRDTSVNASLDMVKLLSEEKQKQYCINYVNRLKNGGMNLSTYTPKASAYLIDYSKSHPLTADEQSDIDFKNGCIERSFNAHADYDGAISQCSCSLNVVKTELSPKERAEILEIEKKKGDIKQLPQVKRITPDIQKCASDTQN